MVCTSDGIETWRLNHYNAEKGWTRIELGPLYVRNFIFIMKFVIVIVIISNN